MSGRTVDVDTGVDSGRVSVGVVIPTAPPPLLDSGPGEPVVAAGSYEVQGDCFMGLVLELPAGEHQTATIQFRAIRVESRREVLGFRPIRVRRRTSAGFQANRLRAPKPGRNS